MYSKGLFSRTSDQWIEGSHQSLNQTIQRTGAWVNDLTSRAHGKKLFRAVCTHNCLNIKPMNIVLHAGE